GDMYELGPGEAELHRLAGEHALAAGAVLLTAGGLARNMGGRHFETAEELTRALPGLLRPGDNVLVKASHSMRFDRIAEYLKTLEL
ncbi:MAG: UDP-N-acetylmuramoyl-tripeptide--D-alanyl-D-alanine ligase, partial [Clostridia bacterium]|nr:UDP-N-acetylmuramoyl-tripeptide--D-alanyl-D-alanine ligase [Clostridia bacterium]